MKVKPLTAAICMFVHHAGWCKSLHREPSLLKSWRTGCMFQDAVILALHPPLIIGDPTKVPLRTEDMIDMKTPGKIIQFPS